MIQHQNRRFAVAPVFHRVGDRELAFRLENRNGTLAHPLPRKTAAFIDVGTDGIPLYMTAGFMFLSVFVLNRTAGKLCTSDTSDHRYSVFPLREQWALRIARIFSQQQREILL